MKNTFWAIFISLFIGIIFIFGAFYLLREKVYYPQQEYLSKQFQAIDLQLEDLSENIEKKAWGQEMKVLTELNEEVKILLEENNKELARQAAIPKNWNVYSDKNWGIEFAYGENWKVFEKTGQNYDWLIIQDELGQEIIIEKRDNLADWQIINKKTGEVFENIIDLVMADLRDLSVMWTFVQEIDFTDYKGHLYLEGVTVYNQGVMVDLGDSFYQIVFADRGENLSEEDEIFLKSIKFLPSDQGRGDRIE